MMQPDSAEPLKKQRLVVRPNGDKLAMPDGYYEKIMVDATGARHVFLGDDISVPASVEARLVSPLRARPVVDADGYCCVAEVTLWRALSRRPAKPEEFEASAAAQAATGRGTPTSSRAPVTHVLKSDDDCTCTGPASPAHEHACPVRKRHPRVDLGDVDEELVGVAASWGLGRLSDRGLMALRAAYQMGLARGERGTRG